MDNKVTIEQGSLIKAYNEASEEQKKMLINLFGKNMFKPLDIKERIKTFEDACNEIGTDDELVIQYNLLTAYTNLNQIKNVLAFMKLSIIAKALNCGWEPSFEKKEHRYYPWFFVYGKKEYDSLDEDDKKKCFIFSRQYGDSNAYVAVSFGSADYDSSYTYSNVNFRLALRTKELAAYCGKQFIDIWTDYLFA